MKQWYSSAVDNPKILQMKGIVKDSSKKKIYSQTKSFGQVLHCKPNSNARILIVINLLK